MHFMLCKCKYCSLRASVSVKNNGNSIVRPHLRKEFLSPDKHRIIKSSLLTNGREGVLLLFTLDEYKQQMWEAENERQSKWAIAPERYVIKLAHAQKCQRQRCIQQSWVWYSPASSDTVEP